MSAREWLLREPFDFPRKVYHFADRHVVNNRQALLFIYLAAIVGEGFGFGGKSFTCLLFGVDDALLKCCLLTPGQQRVIRAGEFLFERGRPVCRSFRRASRAVVFCSAVNVSASAAFILR